MNAIITGELDQIFLVPLDGSTIADVFAESDVLNADYRLSYDARGNPIVRDGDMVVVEVLTDVLGGSLVRVAPMMGDAFEMASFMKDRAEAETLVACEEAAGRAEDMILQLGGLQALRIKGKWRPMDETHRQVWSAHVVQANTQKLRAEAQRNKGAIAVGRRLAMAA